MDLKEHLLNPNFFQAMLQTFPNSCPTIDMFAGPSNNLLPIFWLTMASLASITRGHIAEGRLQGLPLLCSPLIDRHSAIATTNMKESLSALPKCCFLLGLRRMVTPLNSFVGAENQSANDKASQRSALDCQGT